MGLNATFWKDRRVFITGHTGFKGSWLAIWLAEMGANVTGYSLNPPTEPSLFSDARVADRLAGDVRGDIRDRTALRAALTKAAPEVVIHMAAQALVAEGYADPLGTYETNVIGTGNVLMAAFEQDTVRSIVSVASDKCYENREWVYPYRENDRLGGFDPYSSSKGCAEILTESLRRSFTPKARLGSVRAGNVIGGGDWADNRLVPDCVRAFTSRKPVILRRPKAVRPWQFVLEPLAGYLILAERLYDAETGSRFEGAWNFGPLPGSEIPVGEFASRIGANWGSDCRISLIPDSSNLHEAHLLRLDSTKARIELGWNPVLDIDDTVAWTAEWYRQWAENRDLAALTKAQVNDYWERLA